MPRFRVRSPFLSGSSSSSLTRACAANSRVALTVAALRIGLLLWSSALEEFDTPGTEALCSSRSRLRAFFKPALLVPSIRQPNLSELLLTLTPLSHALVKVKRALTASPSTFPSNYIHPRCTSVSGITLLRQLELYPSPCLAQTETFFSTRTSSTR